MLAPAPIFPATLETLHHASTCARGWASSNDAATEMLIELLDAVRDIPAMLHHWDRYQVEDILTQLSGFDHGKWRANVDCDKVFVPDLVQFFNDHI